MRIDIVCVGKIKEKFYRDALGEYTKRLSRYCKLNIYEVDDEKTPDKASDKECIKIMDIEAARIDSRISDDAYVIVLAIEGKKCDSPAFAKKIEVLANQGRSHIVFVIGGSLGIADSIKKRANELLSFSDMTFPHQLMRVILLEQIYRGYRISNNEPYHK